MNQLTKQTRQAALSYARQWLDERKDIDLFGTGSPALRPKAGAPLLRQLFQFKAMSSAVGMMEVIDDARAGWDEADAALRGLAIELMHRKQCPALLEAYAMEALKTPNRQSRGRRKSWNILQDILFVGLMVELVQKFDLYPTRKTERHSDSACDILVIAVTEAKWLKRSRFDYKTAERLWSLYGQWAMPTQQRS
jgi:hypothetical protein